MSEKRIQIKEKELKYLLDTDFLTTKKDILKKLRYLFKETEYILYQEITTIKDKFPPEILLRGGKLSKGENYRSLPFLILDYPRLFKPGNVFAYRTMFWWGNFFSCTLHLQGKILEEYREVLEKEVKNLSKNKIYIGVAENPWEYHYQSSNYKLTNEFPENDLLKIIREKPFIKLSKYIEVEEYEKLPEFSRETLVFYLKVLKILSNQHH